MAGLIAFPEYRPDIADYEGASSKTIQNVLPRGDGYGPVASLLNLTSALPGACRGGLVAYRTDGTVAIFGATSTRLYLLSNTDFTWSDVSKGGSAYSAVASGEQWRLAQFGNFIIAVQSNTVPQVFDLSSPSAFADLGGSPPTARYVDVVGRFLVLSGLVSNPYRIQWSGLNAVTTWTSGTNSSDFQDLPDGGIVRGVAGGEYGVIFQDQSIRRMIYAPGSPLIFQIERIAQDKGLYAPYSLIRAGEQNFFLAGHGLYQILPGQYPVAIGKERVDKTLLGDIDHSNLQLVIGAADAQGTRVYWAYKSISGASGLFDKMLCYDWALDRFSLINLTGEYLLNMAQPGTTLEGLDSISGSIDALTTPLDSFAAAQRPEIGAFDSSHKLSFFRGSNIEATLDSAEQGGTGQRIRVRSFRPVTDAATVYGSCSQRETSQAAATYSSETLINSIGICPQRVDTRYARGRIRIPAGTSWTFASGIEPEFAVRGAR